MMRSLFSGVAGLKTHQTKMDVIGNNIANVNTVAYKSQNVTFQELMYQTTQAASAANAATGRGGINAKQIGLGVQTGAINANITTAGASQTTGNPFDIQIKGDSFFIVSDGSSNFFTRAGAFYVDGMGNLAMTSNGYTVMGWQEDPNKPGTIIKDTVTPLKIMSPENMTSEPEQTTQTYLSGVIDKNSTQLTSTNGLIVNVGIYDSLGYSYIAKLSIKSTDTEGEYSITPLDLVDSQGFSLMHRSDEKGYEKNGFDLAGYEEPMALTISKGVLKYDTQTGKSLNVDENGNEIPFTLNVCNGTYVENFKSEKVTPEMGDSPKSMRALELVTSTPLTYKKTSDPVVLVDSTGTKKDYFELGEVVKPYAGDKPKSKGWYEMTTSGTDTIVKACDSDVLDTTKTYVTISPKPVTNTTDKDPSELGWYRVNGSGEYVLATESTPTNPPYYDLNAEDVTPREAENPSTMNLFELDSNGNYVQTSDLTPDASKRYYEGPTKMRLTPSDNPNELGWYEDYDCTVLSTDKNVDKSKTYYVKVPDPSVEAGAKADAFQSDIYLSVGTSTMYDNKGTSTIKGNAGDYDGNYAGRKVGELSGVAIGQDGKITATYDNGTSKLLGQIAVASFANPSGLEKVGDNLYQSTPNSGTFDGIGEDVTSGSGAMSTGVLEMSNVDLSAEFTDMITTQRGFQANSRIITVSDSMLEELTNLKR